MTTYSEWACNIAIQSGVSPEAIDFIYSALDYVPNFCGEEPGVSNSLQHSNAQELCKAFVGLAKETYGPDYVAILHDWDLNTSEKLGAAIYRLIECGALQRDDTDRLGDFDGRFDLASPSA